MMKKSCIQLLKVFTNNTFHITILIMYYYFFNSMNKPRTLFNCLRHVLSAFDVTLCKEA